MSKINLIIAVLISQFSIGQAVLEAEYFWDTDPGIGNGFPLVALDGNFNQAFETVFSNNTTLPILGNHVLHVRIKGQDNVWSPAFRKVFRVVVNTNTNLEVKITHAEYFWDTDPGMGNGFPLLAFDGNFNQAFETVFSNNASLPTVGNHVLHVRVKGQDNIWSPAFRKVFRVDANNNTNMEVKITQAEYFWNTDPGQGNGISMLALDGNLNQAVETIVANNAVLPSAGLNLLNVRVKANDGNWGTVYKKVIGLNIVHDSQVILSLPTNEATNIPLSGSFVWEQLTSASIYEYQCATDATFTNIIQSGITNGLTVPFSSLVSNTQYYWRVRANDNSNVSLWSVTWSFTTDSNLGIGDTSSPLEIIIYPIPTNSSLNLKFDEGISFESYKIYDFFGKEVQHGKFINNNYTIDVSLFAAGTYVLKLNNQNSIYSFKFIKENE